MKCPRCQSTIKANESCPCEPTPVKENQGLEARINTLEKFAERMEWQLAAINGAMDVQDGVTAKLAGQLAGLIRRETMIQMN